MEFLVFYPTAEIAQAIGAGEVTQYSYPAAINIPLKGMSVEGKQFVDNGTWYPTTKSGKVGCFPSLKCALGVPGDLLVPFQDKSLLLKITNVRVRSLHEVTEAEIKAEGFKFDLSYCYGPSCSKSCNTHGCQGIRDAYVQLMKERYNTGNAWIWVVEFETYKRIASPTPPTRTQQFNI